MRLPVRVGGKTYHLSGEFLFFVLHRNFLVDNELDDGDDIDDFVMPRGMFTAGIMLCEDFLGLS